MRIFAFSGWSNSGKTTLISKLTAELSARQKKVVVIKKGEKEITVQPEAKDTAKFLRSGAWGAFYLSRNEVVNFFSIENWPQVWKNLMTSDIDYLFLEGLFPPQVPVIEIFSECKPQRYRGEMLVATVNRADSVSGIKNFTLNDISAMINFLEVFDEQSCSPDGQ